MIPRDKVTVSELAQMFRDRVGKIYPPGEMEAMLVRTFDHHLQYGKADLILNADKRLHWSFRATIESVIIALEAHEPIQYILGRTEFYGLPFMVDDRALIPRPETEELVRWVIDAVGNREVKILDIGTGSGCIAVALKKHLPRAEVHALDSSSAALDLAAENARYNRVSLHLFLHDILERDSLNFMRFDVMVSNPPYIVEGERNRMDSNVVDHEPHIALFVPDEDPLLFYRHIVDLAEGHLNRGGRLFFEVDERHGLEVSSLMQDRGFKQVELRKDLNGKDRMVRGVRS